MKINKRAKAQQVRWAKVRANKENANMDSPNKPNYQAIVERMIARRDQLASELADIGNALDKIADFQ